MKTSNKILLGTFLTALLIIISLHIALYAKYKKGDYTLVGDDMWPTNMVTYSLRDIKYVSVDNVENVSIHAADSSKLQYDKAVEGDENILSVTNRNDTLFLLGKSNGNSPGRWYRRTHLSLAGPLPIKIINSDLHVQDPKTSNPISMDITLDRSFMEVNNRQNTTTNFAGLKITASNDSRISLFNVRTHLLDITLKNSFLEETTLIADSISITTDQASKLQLSGKNLSKARIVTHE